MSVVRAVTDAAKAELGLATTKIQQLTETIEVADGNLAAAQATIQDMQSSLDTRAWELHAAVAAGQETERKRERLEKLLEHKSQVRACARACALSTTSHVRLPRRVFSLALACFGLSSYSLFGRTGRVRANVRVPGS